MSIIVFERAKKSFLEFLKSEGKSLNTIKNYSSDVEQLCSFCALHEISLEKISISTLESYAKDLTLTHKTNSCRRKLMTAKMFLRFMSTKVDLPEFTATSGLQDSALKLIPPEKDERTPKIISHPILNQILEEQDATDLGIRNVALALVLVETGMLVTEMLALKQSDCRFELFGATLFIAGKRSRTVKVGEKTAKALKALAERLPNASWFFYGYSRAGRNADRMTPRGVELLFSTWNKKYKSLLENKTLHPRSLRHLFVIEWLLAGKTQKEIMNQMGLRTTYSFKVYDPLLLQIAQTEIKITDDLALTKTLR